MGVKISDLPDSGAISDADLIELVQSGASRKGTFTKVKDWLATAVDLSAKVSKTGDVMTGHLEVPAGASGAQAVRASEAQWSESINVPASGTAVDITSIPLGVKDLRIVFSNVGLEGGASLNMEIGGASGVSGSSYAAIGAGIVGAVVGTGTSYSHFPLRVGAINPGVLNGAVDLLASLPSEWAIFGMLFSTTDDRLSVSAGRGVVAGGDPMQRIRIAPTAGTFAGGNFLVSWSR